MLYIRSPELIHLTAGSLYPLTTISLFLQPHSSLWQPLFYSLLLNSAFLDSTYKWEHIVFVFFCLLISLSIMPSRSIHVTKGRIFFFNGWIIFQCVCVCVCVRVCIDHNSKIYNGIINGNIYVPIHLLMDTEIVSMS